MSQLGAPAATRFGALRSPNFRLFWGGLVVDNVFSLMQSVANGWLILNLTDSPFLLGLWGLFRAVPFILCSFSAGVLVDRVDRRKLLIVCQIALTLSPLTLVWLILNGQIQVWHMYAPSFYSGAVASFEGPARQALLPHIVPRSELTNAIALTSIIRKGAALVGPMVGGILIAAYGVEVAFFANAAGHTMAALALGLMRVPPFVAAAQRSFLRSLREGVDYARDNGLVGLFLALEMAPNLLGNFTSMMPVFARDVLHSGPEGLGFLQSAPGLGAIIGSFWLAMQGDVRRKGLIALGGGVVFGLALAAFALSEVFLLSLVLLTLTGALDIVSGALRNTVLQLVIPDRVRGRVMSLHGIASSGTHPLGGLLAGTAGSLVGVPLAVAAGGLLCALAAGAAALRFPAARRFEGTGAGAGELGGRTASESH